MIVLGASDGDEELDAGGDDSVVAEGVFALHQQLPGVGNELMNKLANLLVVLGKCKG